MQYLKKPTFLFLYLSLLICPMMAQSPDIDFKVFGEGDEVLIIPGTRALEVPIYEMLAQNLASAGFKVVLFNPVGTKEDFQMEAYTKIRIADRIEEIELIRKEIGIKNWSVISTGLGNLIACYYVIDYPTRVSKMIFVSPTYSNKKSYGYPAKSNKEDALTKNKRAENLYPEYSKKEIFMLSVDALARQMVENEEYVDSVKESLIRIFPYEHIPELLDEIAESPPDFDYVNRNFSDRILIVTGENAKESRLFRSEREKFMEQFSRAEFLSVQQSGRFVWLEQEKTFYDQVIDFINKH